MNGCFVKPKPLKPVCHMQPTQEIINELEKYRRYILANLDCRYKKILEELSLTDTSTLETLQKVLTEYKEVEASINGKLDLMNKTIENFQKSYEPPKLYEEYYADEEALWLSTDGGYG